MRGKRDGVSKSYLADPERFAQICNNTLFDGKHIVDAAGLSGIDTHEIKAAGLKPEEAEIIWKDRDILKKYQDKCFLAIFGIENQTDIHYCMPLRSLVYDALNYEKQRTQIRKKHAKARDLKGAEYVSGFSKADRLIPVFTIVVYFGKEPWDGPRTLHELLGMPEELEEYQEKLMDYQLNLVEINRMENLEQYEGELKAFLGFLKYHSDMEKLEEYVAENQNEFSSLSCEIVRAMAVMGNAKDLTEYLKRRADNPEREETMNMCKALEDMKKKSWREGRQEGIHALVRENLDEGVSAERIVMKLKKYFELSEEQSLEYIGKYKTEKA